MAHPSQNISSLKPLKNGRSVVLSLRVNDLEHASVEAARSMAGQSQAEWLREAVLAHARSGMPASTKSYSEVTLEEILGLRHLLVNLFAHAIPACSVSAVMEIMASAEQMKSKEAACALDAYSRK